MLCAALLRNTVLLRRQLVPDGFRRGLLIVARIDAQPGKQLHLRARDVAVAARIFFEVVLMVFLGGIVVFKRADLHKEFLAAAALDLRDALHCFSRAFVGVVDAGLVLAAPVVALPVLYRGVDHIEVGQQQRVEAHLLGVVFHPHGLPKAGLSLADGLVIGVRLAGAVGVAALGVDNAGDGLHQLFHTPEAAARQIDDILCGIHIGDLLIGPVKGRSVHVCFLFALFLRHSLPPGGAAAQQQHRGEKQCQYASIHRVSSFQWNPGSLRPVAVLSLAATGPQDGIQQRPKDAVEAGGEPRVGRNGTGAGGAAHIAVIQPPSGTAHQGQGNGTQNARQLTVLLLKIKKMG